ncbi:sigma factor-like helix-turn-helix DNA-binding protein [Paenibacillus terrigena]|uniref:sigma factor-like helix-turn-helix DNA-binding protein n=1 Tax=Paenibacillus terrigena TaxID=369333 RepID=UPI0003609921|nr:sigma factor-like helix-turn-helix DNA-binding protein [Paenibacillus terrigena]
MGHVKKIDIHAKERSYTQKYALNTAGGVKALLRDRHQIANRRFKGDTAASDILIDLHSAIESAELTERQAEVIAWVYGVDATQTEAARIMGITQQTVGESLAAAEERIAAVFSRWDYGEISVELEAPQLSA